LHSIKIRLSDYCSHSDLDFIFLDLASCHLPVLPRFDFIIHSASQASPKYFYSDPVGTLLANTVGTSLLLRHASSSSCKRFLFFSSGEIYGSNNCSSSNLSETDLGTIDHLSVRSSYVESKRAGENMCVCWYHQMMLDTLIVRPFHTYGPGMSLSDGRVFADFVSNVVSGSDIIINSDGKSRRAFCYVADATIAFLKVLFNGNSPEVYNVGNPQCDVSIAELADIVASVSPFPTNVRFQLPYEPSCSSSTSQACPDVSKLKDLGWSFTTDLSQGFRRTIDSYL
jgi:nucleoside-diphosphate-sugar epimerase